MSLHNCYINGFSAKCFHCKYFEALKKEEFAVRGVCHNYDPKINEKYPLDRDAGCHNGESKISDQISLFEGDFM